MTCQPLCGPRDCGAPGGGPEGLHDEEHGVAEAALAILSKGGRLSAQPQSCGARWAGEEVERALPGHSCVNEVVPGLCV